MENSSNKTDQLLQKLEVLLKQQEHFQNEINALRREIESLKSGGKTAPVETIKAAEPAEPPKASQIQVPPPVKPKPAPKKKSDWEKFIGENLINKIGIVVLVIGVAIGAKYAIDHQLISPLTRIILGYLCGIGLLGFAIKLKEKYTNFSAVLLSGALAIMYFITYAAYSFYDLLPQIPAFVLMVLFTVFAVVAAIHYDKQVIAHIGLVGAYAVPFLLSEDTGRVAILFSYMTIINTGILFISFKRYWKPLYYSAFFLTWLIYIGWIGANYDVQDHFALALIFVSVFFIIFYLTFLFYKLIREEKFDAGDIICLLINSFIFFGYGYAILDGHKTGTELLGLFTLANALIHFAVVVPVYQKKLADKNLFYLIAGLVLLFITLAVPVQLDGQWVTLFWAGEAVILFTIGRLRQISFYEKLSYPLILLAFFSMIQDWNMAYGNYDPAFLESRITPVFNVHFLSSLLLVAGYLFINIIHAKKEYGSPFQKFGKNLYYDLIRIAIPAILLISIFFSVTMEIDNYFNQLYLDSQTKVVKDGYTISVYDSDYSYFNSVWVYMYMMLFVSVLSLINIKKLQSRGLGWTNIALNLMVLALFLFAGLYELSELRESYISQYYADYFNIGIINILIRYIAFIFLALLLFGSYLYTRQSFLNRNLKPAYHIVLNITLFWVVSSEWIHWMDLADSAASYKLGLSILWGVYALILMTWGILRKLKHLRIMAIIIFSVTLLKLFFYDLSHFDTIEKTIVFIVLGTLLLIVSFLYNKFRHVIYDEKTR
ncbi:MAG: DUF2339 domain-containing protein [Calditrichaceae bacterium]|nr:DUF2339 domain-containing protein [Calditrichaceae bacterium]MBN2708716.1 DUF2339 domain-containing protein [Calditrichaceae bacterium]RQV92828.1 MAG: DUF2339 domain-containing protein [Calditrichota bacterium]